MTTNVPWNKNDAVVTVDGINVGRVKDTVNDKDENLLIIIGDINPEIIDFFPEQPSNSGEIPFKFSFEVDSIEDYNDGVIRLPNYAPDTFQSSYNEKVQEEMEMRLRKMEEGLEKGLKLGENEDPSIVNEVQENIRQARKTIRKGIKENRFDGKGQKYLERMDKIEERFQEIMFEVLQNQGASEKSGRVNSNSTEHGISPSETKMKDNEVKSELDDFYDHMENKLLPKVKEAKPETRVELLKDGLQGVKEMKAMVRGFDKSDVLENTDQYYEELDELEEALREDKQNALEESQNSGTDMESIFKSISEGLQAYSEAKKATNKAKEKSNRNRTNNQGHSRPRNNQNNQQRDDRKQNDPYTGGKSQSSSISESVSRFWNTVTLQNAFSPKCPRCNRKSSAPVSGEEDVYQCDNCGNVFDTHPDSRREIDFDNS